MLNSSLTVDAPKPVVRTGWQLNVATLLYAVIFALALALRLAALGAAPLSENEASWALQALSVARHQAQSLGALPGYIVPTGFLFWLFGASNAAARFWPALGGSLLTLLPLWLPRSGRLGLDSAEARSRLQLAGIIFSFWIAVDPGLVTLSRQAGGSMLAVSFTLLALAAFFSQRRLWAGVFGGLALLGGPSLLTGLLGLALAWGISALFRNIHWLPPLNWAAGGEEPSGGAQPTKELPRSATLWAGVATLIIAGTLFLQVPQGFASWVGTIPAYLQSWTTPGLPPLSVLVLLPLTLPFPFLMGLAGAVSAWVAQDEDEIRTPARLLSLWLAGSLLVLLVYPARQSDDLLWALAPLYGLAALELARPFAAQRVSRLVWRVIFFEAGFVFLMAMLIAQFLGNIYQLQKQWALGYFVQDPNLYTRNLNAFLLVIGGAAAIVFIATILTALSWSAEAAWRGFLAGVGLALMFYQFSMLWGSAFVRPNSSLELWTQSPGVAQTGLLMDTVGDFSVWATGDRLSLDIWVTTDSQALRWELRDYHNARFAALEAAQESPSLLITSVEQATPQTEALYRGQDFTWRTYPGWEGPLPPDLLAWLMDRRAPLASEQVILWARTDLFPGGQLLQPEAPFLPTEPTFPGEEPSRLEELPEQ